MVGPTDVLIHLLNFVLPAIGVGVLSALLTKLLWRGLLRRVSLASLAAWSSAAGLVVLVLGLLVFGHDGKMATYGAMVLASALALWWAGFRGKP